MSTLPPLVPVPVEDGSYETPPHPPVEGEAPPRIPNLAHALLLFSIAFVLLVLAQGLLLVVTGAWHDPRLFGAVARNPKYVLTVQAVVYLGTILIAWLVFPMLWQRPFPEGIQWNAPKARDLAWKLIAAGIALSFTVQTITSFITMPKSMPMDDFFRTRSDVWLITIFGTFLAPAVEEIFFRGFLFPAFAIAYDWLSLPRTPEAILNWRSTTTLTIPSFFFSGLLTSIFFAGLHAPQLGHTWTAVAVLLCVSFVFTWVRVRTQSVACSTLLHASYNFSVFLAAFIVTGGFRHLEKMTR
jgi:membrane protease YdiL (CAAX protease family)